jgi:hypothetical protein
MLHCNMTLYEDQAHESQVNNGALHHKKSPWQPNLLTKSKVWATQNRPRIGENPGDAGKSRSHLPARRVEDL